MKNNHLILPYISKFARTKGARDKRKRKQRSSGNRKGDGLKGARQLELTTRSVANLGRGLNSVSNSVEQARITAKYFGINPASTAKLSGRAALKENLGLARNASVTGRNLFNIGRSAARIPSERRMSQLRALRLEQILGL